MFKILSRNTSSVVCYLKLNIFTYQTILNVQRLQPLQYRVYLREAAIYSIPVSHIKYPVQSGLSLKQYIRHSNKLLSTKYSVSVNQDERQNG